MNDPLLALYLFDVGIHLSRLDRVPRLTGSVLLVAFVNHVFRRKELTFKHALVPERVVRRYFLAKSLLTSPFLNMSWTELISGSMPMLMTGSILESRRDPNPSCLFVWALLAPSVMLSILAKTVAAISGRSSIQRKHNGDLVVQPNFRVYYGLTPMLFCLQTVLNICVLAPAGGRVGIYGSRMHATYAHWWELLMYELMSHGSGGSTLLSRLSGILSGYVYAYIRNVDLGSAWSRNSRHFIRRVRLYMRQSLQYFNFPSGDSEPNALPNSYISSSELRRRRLVRFDGRTDT